MFNIKSLHDWLEENKIFFEITTSFLLGIMAVILSVQANMITFSANKIALHQTELTKLQDLPILKLSANLIYDQASKLYAHDELIISNDGGPLVEFDYHAITFLKIKYAEENKAIQTALLPIIGYYYPFFPTGKTTGILTRSSDSTSNGNNLKVDRIDREFSEFAKKTGAYAYGSVSILRYVNVWYTDIWGDFHNDMYYVDTFGSLKMTDSDEEKFIRDNIQSVDIDEISPLLLYKTWLEQNKI